MEIGQVYYDAGSQWILNLVLASMILSVALDINWRDFRSILSMPKSIIAGLGAQFLILPALTTGLTLTLELPAGIELGMILVASCPGGAISNFVTHISGGNTALSISMTAAASVIAIFMMPLNFVFWAQINPETAAMMQSIEVSGTELFINLFVVLAIPLSLGLLLKRSMPNSALILHKVLKTTSFLALIAFILIAVVKNYDAFTSHFAFIFTIVLIHNAIALGLGFSVSKLTSRNVRDTKAITIEVGMQNSSLAIAIVFMQFNAEPGMALICAFWGTWHIVSGVIIAFLFRQWGKNSSNTISEVNS